MIEKRVICTHEYHFYSSHPCNAHMAEAIQTDPQAKFYAVITHMRQQLQGRANNDDSASDSSSSEELRKFSFDWFSKHFKARQYFLGLDDDAFEWLDANFTPEVLSKCSVTVFCVTFILSLLNGVLCDLAMHSSQLLYVCPSHICS